MTLNSPHEQRPGSTWISVKLKVSEPALHPNRIVSIWGYPAQIRVLPVSLIYHQEHSHAVNWALPQSCRSQKKKHRFEHRGAFLVVLFCILLLLCIWTLKYFSLVLCLLVLDLYVYVCVNTIFRGFLVLIWFCSCFYFLLLYFFLVFFNSFLRLE